MTGSSSTGCTSGSGDAQKPDPKAGKPDQDHPEQLGGRSEADVENELDQKLVKDGHWSKSTSRDGNGVRYTDGKGGSIIINKGYPGGMPGGDAVHQGPVCEDPTLRRPCTAGWEPGRGKLNVMEVPQTNAQSFEQDLLWSILDQDAVPDILRMAHDRWNVDAASAWNAVVREARLGRLRAYHGEAKSTPVDLAAASLADVADDFELYVEPTDATRTALAEFERG